MSTNLKFLTTALLSAFVVLSVSSSTILNPEFERQSQHRAQPIEENYTPNGHNILLDNMTIYETVNTNVDRILIVGYDAYGFSDTMKQLVDKLADGFGFKIVIPDFFRGGMYNTTFWNVTVETDTMTVINHYRSTENVTKFGVFGFCWGGLYSTQAATFIPNEIKAAALVHPSLISTADANGVEVPMYLLPSRGEPNMLPFYMVLQQKFGTNTGHRRFDDMAHGFAGAGANFSNPLNRIRVDEVIDIMGNFFDRNVV